MFGKRCSLCGGKLNSSGICTECGLDNSKSDKNYRINRSDCDGMPLTHVHEEKEKYRPDRKADHREINHKETNHKKRVFRGFQSLEVCRLPYERRYRGLFHREVQEASVRSCQ